MSQTINIINLDIHQPAAPLYAKSDKTIQRSREERVLSICRQSKQHGFAVRFWEGITGASLPCTNISRAFKQIVRWAKERELPTVKIGEDDLVFTAPGAWQFYLENTPHDFDLYIGGLYGGTIQATEFPSLGKVVNGYSGNTLITVHERFYDFFLSADEGQHLDQWLGTHAYEKEYYVVTPHVVKQLGGYSENHRADRYYTELEKARQYYSGS